MKPKKTSILLISVVGTLVFVLLVINLSQYVRNDQALDENQAPNSELIKKLQERAAQATSPDGAKLATASGLRTMNGNVLAASKGEVPATPSIELPSPQLYKPNFDANTTSAHWYNDESYQKVNAKKRQDRYDAGK